MYLLTKTTTIILILISYQQATVLKIISALETSELLNDSGKLIKGSNYNSNKKYLLFSYKSYNRSESDNRNKSDILSNKLFINTLDNDDDNKNYNFYETIPILKKPPHSKENEGANWKRKTETQRNKTFHELSLEEFHINHTDRELPVTNNINAAVLQPPRDKILNNFFGKETEITTILKLENPVSDKYRHSIFSLTKLLNALGVVKEWRNIKYMEARHEDNGVDFAIDNLLMNFQVDRGDSCLLDVVKKSLLSWCFSDGSLPVQYPSKKIATLDLSRRNRDDYNLSCIAYVYRYVGDYDIFTLSAAYNHLPTVPYKTLSVVNDTLIYLTLKGNTFNTSNNQIFPFVSHETAWATFPPLHELLELDLSDCSIEFVSKAVFRNLPNLRRLLLAHNRMAKISTDTFFHTPFLSHLDLSFIKTSDSILNRVFRSHRNLFISKKTFANLHNLNYLDLSYTTLWSKNTLAFEFLPNSLNYLSLCYTGYQLSSSRSLNNTSLVGLDLSGNRLVSYHNMAQALGRLKNSLRYLHIEKANIRNISWLQSLPNLQKVSLRGNSIDSLSPSVFQKLPQLLFLDLNSNKLGNWYKRVFADNLYLRMLSLRNNKINIISTEMLEDFQHLMYLDIGDNDFVCDCLLNDIVETASANYKIAECVIERHSSLQGLPFQTALDTYRKVAVLSSLPAGFIHYLKSALPVLEKLLYVFLKNHMSMQNYPHEEVTTYSRCVQLADQIPTLEKLNSTRLQLQLIDYGVENYWCYNESERIQLGQLNCQRLSVVTEIEQQISSLITCVLSGVGGLIGVTLLCVLVYLYRWHIRYYYSSLKSAALVSLAMKETSDKFNELSETNPNMIYDIFVSYCQNDRRWIMEELLPNIESDGDISICMHERDFQIGLTILDNIISCMDRSKALMLIISTNFLLSHWCQFEMHLAQHRMFEASKEHLIIVFLEDIPRSKRPKTLQYLMDVKTYIKWPRAKGNKEVKSEEKKMFWKRMRRSLENIGIQLRKK